MSKLTFDVAYFNEEVKYLGCFSNDKKGFDQFVKRLSELTNVPQNKWLILFEHTGTYSKRLKKYVQSSGIACVEEQALKIKRNAPLKRGKSDPIDAKMICEYGVEKQYKLQADIVQNPTVEKLRLLFSRRELLIKQRTALSNTHKEQKILMSADLDEHLEKMYTDQLDLLNSQILAIEKLMKTYISEDEQIKENYDLVTSVVGIGLIAGILIICYTNNFTKYKNARKFAAFCGVAPYPNESGGNVGRWRISKKGNKIMKGVISHCVLTAIQHDAFIKGYYNRLIEKNKPKGVIYNNIKNKLISRVFAAVKRKSPYVKLAYQ